MRGFDGVERASEAAFPQYARAEDISSNAGGPVHAVHRMPFVDLLWESNCALREQIAGAFCIKLGPRRDAPRPRNQNRHRK